MTRATVIVRRVSRRLPEPVVAPVEPDLSEYLTINQVCEWLGITGNTLLAWRECGTVPTPLRRSA